LANPLIETKPPDLQHIMEMYPRKIRAEMKRASADSLIAIQKAVPAYPPEKPNQRYIRTGKLGKRFGVTMTGYPLMTPDIYTVEQFGDSQWVATYGTTNEYSPDVIGAGVQESDFVGRWWTEEDVATTARPKIYEAFEQVTIRIGKWFNGLRS
jgi:hypothetical protein